MLIFLGNLSFEDVGQAVPPADLDQDRKDVFATLHRTIQRVALDGLAAGLADQAQQFAAAQIWLVVAPAS